MEAPAPRSSRMSVTPSLIEMRRSRVGVMVRSQDTSPCLSVDEVCRLLHGYAAVLLTPTS
jgi:hypothetical protein